MFKHSNLESLGKFQNLKVIMTKNTLKYKIMGNRTIHRLSPHCWCVFFWNGNSRRPGRNTYFSNHQIRIWIFFITRLFFWSISFCPSWAILFSVRWLIFFGKYYQSPKDQFSFSIPCFFTRVTCWLLQFSNTNWSNFALYAAGRPWFGSQRKILELTWFFRLLFLGILI